MSTELASAFPLCPIYKEQVLPDENDLCSLCGTHSASELDERGEYLKAKCKGVIA